MQWVEWRQQTTYISWLILSEFSHVKRDLLSAFAYKFPRKDSNWTTLDHIPLFESMTMAKETVLARPGHMNAMNYTE